MTRRFSSPIFASNPWSYADIVAVSYSHFGKRVGEDIFEQVVMIVPSFYALYMACVPHLGRADH